MTAAMQLTPRRMHSRPVPSPGLRGWGDSQTAAKGVQVGASAAAPVITGILASHAAATAAATGSAVSILGMAPAVAIPVIGAALLGATILITSLIKNSGCGQTCVVTSQWANQAEAGLKQNLDAYFSLPSPRTTAQQGVALANFDAIWEALKQQCGQPGTGDAGKRCISDRERGACKWKDNGQCWNWFVGYRDPIANDQVVSQLQAAESLVSGAVGADWFLPALVVAGLVVAGVTL